MTKRMLLAVGLVLALALLSACSVLPELGMNSLLQHSEDTQAQADGDYVYITKEQYEAYKRYDTLLGVLQIVEQDYYQETDENALLDGAAQGYLSAMKDPYTYYYTPEEYRSMWEDDEGEYAGVGILISANYETGLCTCARIFKDSPAEAAGVHRGDILYQVEELSVTAENLQDAVDIMRGTPGTDVRVSFLRDGEVRETVMTRAVINVNRVESCMLDDEVGYIEVYEFAGDCADRFGEALDDLISRGAKSLVLDLRDNSGGWVKDAESMADRFLDGGVIYYTEYRDGSRQYSYATEGKTDIPLTVLINENSASSSEILSGALKDRAGATLVGVQSYGKGIIQAVTEVGNRGAGMQLTVAQYYTPAGNAVHKIGLTPDVEIALEEGDNGMYEFGDLSDPQLRRAYEVAREKLAQ